MKKLVFTVGTLLTVMSAYAQSNVIVTNSVTGNGNTSSITQTMQAVYGADNKASVTIMGNSNSAKLKQTGGGLVSTTTQTGNTNQSDVTQVGAYSANSESQTATNGATNKSVVTSNGQGITSQVYQQADGAGSGNDMMLDQTGNNSYLGSQQNATAGGMNKVDWKQTGYDATMNIGSRATINQTASGAGSKNTLMGNQNVDTAPSGASTPVLIQEAYAGGVNMGAVNQSGTNADANLNQYATGMGSKNTISIDQNGINTGVLNSALIFQDAFMGGENTSLSNQRGSYQYAFASQVATGAGSKNFTNVSQEGLGQYSNTKQNATTPGSKNEAMITQLDKNNVSFIDQGAASANSKNTATVKQGTNSAGNGNNSVISQTAVVDGQNEATVTQDGNNKARIDQRANSVGVNKGTITQLGVGNQAFINQFGTNNTATEKQTGMNSTAIINQTGMGNTASSDQMGNNDSFNLTQMGNNNMATIMQSGNNQMGGVTTVMGNGNTTIISQN